MAGLTNIKNQALTERIEDHLFQYILDERLAVGAKLPNEYELADRFGVSRGTIQEAVKREALYVYRPLNGQRFTYASAGQSARAASSAMTMTSRWSCRIDAGT